MTGRGRILVPCCCALSLLLILVPWARAQVQDSTWSEPYRLSGKGSASGAAIVADRYGFVHAFWAEAGLPNSRSIIQYARFDGSKWEGPVDIYAGASGTPVGFVAVSIDQKGILHLAWTEGITGPVYLNSAPAYDALSASKWSGPLRVDVPAYWVKLQVDSKGDYHLVYTKFEGEELGVYYIRSRDGGRTWSKSFWLDPDIPATFYPLVLQFVIDDSDNLHAVWYYNEQGQNGRGQSIRYAHSFDGGENWSFPFTIDNADRNGDGIPMPYPALVAQGKTVHVIWAGDGGVYRVHRYSNDGGKTWTKPMRFSGNLLSQAMGDGVGVDAAGRLHFVTLLRYPMGLYHAYWDQDHWTALSMFYLVQGNATDSVGGRIQAHNIRLAVRAGNQLVITFTSPPSASQLVLYTMNRTLGDIAASPIEPTPATTQIPMPRSSPTTAALPPIPVGTPEALLIDPNIAMPTNEETPVQPIIWGLLPPFLLMALVALHRVLRVR